MASITTPTPRGFKISSMQPAIWAVIVFLHLETPREAVDYSRQFADADDSIVGR